ncbi:RNA degradosome polyphosphate kinase [Turicibacter sanguinis]|uniref:RNA degradosome polyphosphate kinase n=1 Tax=Turicibacter sanguinis TaxID=154288 RepID=UPI0011C8CD2B|nr:RNA degradosome polyphosphate kinase [Turicibacter sanguinis]MDB8436353.1 RNA degradosome polyphosphate kinase [Turicibacter sanguinis]MDB8459710.1 RNA degradosome polyphosphate kinase [Turicibacter sanguinis]MDB8563942.1 RNA degradosome polyphosphate kinase [Turicibacter sanguinis]MDB8575486.1 RNA degradosome polyphosphate kinase [Turicibacter sanguinis]MDB8577795.1 RNA degradosome polyphosphate kinase [Turicibacter sanguinis]
MTLMMDQPSHFLNRELSLLEFNQRVLEEAKNIQNPLLERIKFLSIVSSNLDEFFMVRIAGLYDLCQASVVSEDISGRLPYKTLRESLEKTRQLVKEQYETYDLLMESLKDKGIYLVTYEQLDEKTKKEMDDYYRHEIYPVLTPMVIDQARPFPLISDKTLNIGLLLKEKLDGDLVFATIQVPSVLPRLVRVPSEEGIYHLLLEDLIKAKLSELFSSHYVLHSSCYRITKNAAMHLDEEDAEDLLETIEQSLKQRKWGEIIRIEIEDAPPREMIEILESELEIEEDYVFRVDGPIDLTFLSKLSGIKGYEELKFEKLKPLYIPELKERNIFQVLKERDVLLHHPFQSFDPIVKMIQKAADDPKVLAIKQTLYRVSGNSPIVEALARAAENGKQVTVLVELKARFDEENNIHWAKKLEKSGCHVIYGMIGLKTHCKILLIVRKEKTGLMRYVHFGTGNYNDVTANFYTDIGIMTSDMQFGEDASILFNMLSGYASAHEMKKITIAPHKLRLKFEQLINREIEHAKKGREAKIIAKMNGLYDKQMILKLYEASQAGVKIELIVRGVCSLRPQVPGLSENITVRSIVGRYLEHSRIYYFYNDGNEEVYISSADWMYRNLSKRVETMGIVEDKEILEQMKKILELYLQDNTKAYELQADGSYVRVQDELHQVHAQSEMVKLMKGSKSNPKRYERLIPVEPLGRTK